MSKPTIISYPPDVPNLVPGMDENNTFTGVNTFSQKIALSGSGRVNVSRVVSLSGIGKGVSAPTETRTGNTFGWAFTIGDDGYFTFEPDYGRDSTTDVIVKIHWHINEAYATNSGEVKWQIDYTSATEGTDTIDGATASLDTGDVNIHATAKTLMESLITIPAANVSVDDVVFCKISRVALTGGNNPTAEPVITSVEVETTNNKLGE